MKGQGMTRTQAEVVILLLGFSLFCFIAVSGYAIYHVEAFKAAFGDSIRTLNEAEAKLSRGFIP